MNVSLSNDDIPVEVMVVSNSGDTDNGTTDDLDQVIPLTSNLSNSVEEPNDNRQRESESGILEGDAISPTEVDIEGVPRTVTPPPTHVTLTQTPTEHVVSDNDLQTDLSGQSSVDNQSLTSSTTHLNSSPDDVPVENTSDIEEGNVTDIQVERDSLLDHSEVEDQGQDETSEIDPWSVIPEFQSNKPKWSELTRRGKVKRVLVDWIGKFLLVLLCLYFFMVALALMGDAFTLIGGTAAGAVLSDSSILENAICGVMVGMLTTVLLQSSSATTSIIVSMVAADIIQVQEAIPMVMGANLGTSVTNTIVAGGQAGDRDSFRLSFAGATVHDCFNWLSVAVLLPLEMISGYLYHMTSAIVNSSNLDQIQSADRIKITNLVTDIIIQLDLAVLEKVALGEEIAEGTSLVDRWCVTEEHYYNVTVRDANGTVYNYTEVLDYIVYIERCPFLFAHSDLSDKVIGLILLVLSLVLLMACLVGIVKLLNSMLHGSAANATKKFLNASFPGYLAWLTGYVAMLIGCLFTMLLQSSSVFTSMLTPLVGMRVITLERMYPLTLGANLGTTFTSLLAAFASSSSIDFIEGVQISLCHLFFNLSGILLWYPVPFMRRPPIKGAKFLGNTTAKYRWFSIAYIFTVFFIIPIIAILLSVAGWQYLAATMIICGVILALVITLNVLQSKCSQRLPKKLQTWDFLPKCLRSLEPYDQLFIGCKKRCKCCGDRDKQVCHEVVQHHEVVYL
ncbi:sodium-dependent phosphate transport protein 2A-like [Glandiceps talaboti]